MPRVLKSSNVVIDRDNRVLIKTIDFNFNNNFNKIEDTQKNIEKDDEKDDDINIEEVKSRIENVKKNIIQNAYNTSDELINNAKQEASKILSEAKQEADALIEQCRLENEKTGYDEGYKKGLMDSKDLVEKAQLELENAQKEKLQVIKNTEGEMINLIINILDKLLFKAIKINRDVILCLIEQGLDGATLTDNVTIRVSPNAYDVVIENKENILAKLNATTNIEIIKDFSLDETDCIIETPFGNIDSSLKNQYESLKEDLYYLLEIGETVENN